MDSDIDYYWFRNREVSRTRTLAETDQFCFDATVTQLRDCLAIGDLQMHLYHTGFEPAVLGFYRGLIQTLIHLRGQGGKPAVAVRPFYYRGADNYEPGTVWR